MRFQNDKRSERFAQKRMPHLAPPPPDRCSRAKRLTVERRVRVHPDFLDVRVHEERLRHLNVDARLQRRTEAVIARSTPAADAGVQSRCCRTTV